MDAAATLSPSSVASHAHPVQEEVAGILGEALAPEAAALRAMVEELRQTRRFRSAHFAALDRIAAGLERLSRTSQQIARVGTGRLRQSHERLSLDQVIHQVLAHDQARLAQAGVQVDTNLRNEVEVIVDPGLLVSLVEAAIGSQLPHGRLLSVRLDVRNWPEHAFITLVARPGVDGGSTGSPVTARETPDWLLLQRLAHATGTLLHREVVGREVILTLEFPRTVKKLEGLTAVEVDGGAGGPLSESKPLAGYRILLISSDPAMREEVQQVCREMALVLDSSPSVAKAVRYCELDKPDLILVDERLHDAQFDQLRADLLRYDVNFPFVELSADLGTVELSSWMGDSISRVGRGDVRKQLPSVLVMELAKVF